MQTVFVTGGAGFIGSALIRKLIKETDYTVINIDNLTYAGNLESLKEVLTNSRHIFKKLNILNKEEIKNLLIEYNPIGIFHLAAESHVDRSIVSSNAFINTNINGTYTLLECVKEYLSETNKNFKFLHVSTDEVFGSLQSKNEYFSESTPYDPRSPYSASKASSDMLVRAWYHTYNVPIVITNCTNNYGPFQFPEKLISLIVNNALELKSLPIYGKGENIRDWLFVDDHVEGLLLAFQKGKIGESYCIGGNNEKTNLEVVETICNILDEIKPRKDNNSYKSLISFVKDRYGHDYRYAMDSSKIKKELGWEPKYTFETGILETVKWYLNNQEWVKHVQSGEYMKWVEINYANR